MNEFQELETRRKIFGIISENPGLHLSKIAEIAGIRISLAEYHLDHLDKNNIISSKKEAGYKRYYSGDSKIGVRDRKVLSILRQETPLRIILHLLKNPYSTHKEILKKFDKAPSTISYYLMKLVKIGVIGFQRHGGEKGYVIINEKEIVGLIIRYKPHNVLEGFKGVWKDLGIE